MYRHKTKKILGPYSAQELSLLVIKHTQSLRPYPTCKEFAQKLDSKDTSTLAPLPVRPPQANSTADVMPPTPHCVAQKKIKKVVPPNNLIHKKNWGNLLKRGCFG